MFLFVLSLAACGRPEQVTPLAAPTTMPSRRAYVDQLDGTKLSIVVYEGSKPAEVDVTGLYVDIYCAKKYGWSSRLDNFRITLLEGGCAKITSSSPTAEESRAQKSAEDEKLNLWAAAAPSAATSTPVTGSEKVSPPPGWLTGAWSWFKSNWLATLSALFALLAIPGFIKRLKRRKYQRSVDVILFGLNGAGKTDLWTAWADGSAPNSNAAPSTEIRRKTNLMPVPCGEYTLLPNVVDGVGGDPAGMLDSMRKTPRRHKRVLIFVVAPTRENERHEPPVDPSFVLEQTGYSAFPRALIGAKDANTKPDLVIIFFSKFDLLASATADDTASRESRDSLLREFSNLKHAVERECLNNHVAFDHIVGSAKFAWNVEKLRNKVAELIFGGRSS